MYMYGNLLSHVHVHVHVVYHFRRVFRREDGVGVTGVMQYCRTVLLHHNLTLSTEYAYHDKPVATVDTSLRNVYTCVYVHII